MKPKLCPTQLSSGRTSNVVIFSMKEMILRMVTNKSIFHPGNLLLDPINPCAEPLDDGYYGDVNSGKWHTNAKKMNVHLRIISSCVFVTLLMVCQWINMESYLWK